MLNKFKVATYLFLAGMAGFIIFHAFV